MTRTQKLMALIEARNPISHAEMLQGTGWNKGIIRSALDRLVGFGVVRIAGNNDNGKRVYGPVQ